MGDTRKTAKTKIAVVRPRSLAKGLIAGLIGGVIGTLARTVTERIFPPHSHDEATSPTYPTSPARSLAAEWAVGVAVGAAYGAVAEYYPAATAKEGASFGMALGTITREAALVEFQPDASAEPHDESTRETASELTSYIAYGVTTEWVRDFVRKRI